MSRGLQAIVVLLSAAGVAGAEEWRTPDGAISVAVPDPTRFVQGNPVPPGLALWESRDGTMQMAIGGLPSPPNGKLRQSPVEQGFMKEMSAQWKNAMLVSSVVEQRNGCEVLTMTARGTANGTPAYLTQTLTVAGGKAYKAMVVGFGRDTRTDPDATAFIESFKILVPSSPAPVQPAPRDAGPVPNQKAPVDQVSYTAGMIAGACLFVAGIAWVVNRLTRSTAKEPRPRRGRPERDRRHDDDDDDEDA